MSDSQTGSSNQRNIQINEGTYRETHLNDRSTYVENKIDQSQTFIYNYYYKEQASSVSYELIEGEGEKLPCPYRGLFHFRPEDADFFFGRDIFINELYEATQNQSFIPILGASGVGKSSVVFAGLVPRLVESGYWKFTYFRPGKNPFYAISQALVPLYARNLSETEMLAQAYQLAKWLRDRTILLADVFTTILRNYPNNRILLVADQFEELYTLCQEEKERRIFIDTILDALYQVSEQFPLSVVLVATIRIDFLGSILSYPPFADVIRDVDIKIRSMNSDELREAIEKPAGKVGVHFEQGLVERIISDVEDEPGSLPLLEFSLTKLWEERKRNKLTHEAYEAIGKVSGALTLYADEKYSRLKPGEKIQARRIFVQLVNPGYGTEDTRRVATRAELNDDDWGLVKKLADARLVVTSYLANSQAFISHLSTPTEAANESVEIVHEALILNWEKMKEWIDED